MCEFSGKLIAWLDRELAADDAASVERHLESCAECRSCMETYRQVSTTFDQYCDAYCDAVMASAPSHERRLLRAWEAAALAAAAIAALFLFVARAHVQLSPGRVPVPPVGTSAAAYPNLAVNGRQNGPSQPQNVSAEQRGQAGTSPQTYYANDLPAEPAVEIAIPADAIFPPGAVPEGVSFDADVTIAPDGSAQQIRLRPQLTEYERRSSQP